MRNAALLIPLLALLSACGNPHQDAADACMAEVRNRLADKNFEVDVNVLAESATPDGNAILLMAPIVFDRALDSEYAQQVECRVRVEGGKPNVIFLQFNWSVDDIRKSQ